MGRDGEMLLQQEGEQSRTTSKDESPTKNKASEEINDESYKREKTSVGRTDRGLHPQVRIGESNAKRKREKGESGRKERQHEEGSTAATMITTNTNTMERREEGDDKNEPTTTKQKTTTPSYSSKIHIQ